MTNESDHRNDLFRIGGKVGLRFDCFCKNKETGIKKKDKHPSFHLHIGRWSHHLEVNNPFSSRCGSQSKVTQDADVSKLLAVPVRVQTQQEGPLKSHEAPHGWQVETLGVRQSWRNKKTQKVILLQTFSEWVLDYLDSIKDYCVCIL